MEFDTEDGEIFDDDGGEFSDESSFHDMDLRSITVTVDQRLLQRQASFESCLSKFLESARREADANASIASNSDKDKDEVRSKSSRSSAHRSVNMNLKNEHRHHHHRGTKKMKVMKDRRKKAKSWIDANRDSFGEHGRSYRAPSRNGVHDSRQQVCDQARSPDDLRHRLNELRSSRSGTSISSRGTDVQVHGQRVREEIREEEERDEYSLPDTRNQNVREMEIAQTNSELELLIAEARLINSRNDTIEYCNNHIRPELAKIKECRGACERLESTAESLRSKLATLSNELTQEKREVRFHDEQVWLANEVVLQRKTEYNDRLHEYNAMTRRIVEEESCPCPARTVEIEYPHSTKSRSHSYRRRHAERGQRHDHSNMKARARHSEESKESIESNDMKTSAHIVAESVHDEKSENDNGSNNASETHGAPAPSMVWTWNQDQKQSRPYNQTCKNETHDENNGDTTFADILIRGIDGVQDTSPKLLKFVAYKSCLFGSLLV